jgi:TolB-like protein
LQLKKIFSAPNGLNRGFYDSIRYKFPAVGLLLILAGCAAGSVIESAVPTPAGDSGAVNDAAAVKTRIAILPVENLYGGGAPVDDIRKRLEALLLQKGVSLLGTDDLAALLQKNRIRYTSGLDTTSAKAFKEQAGVDGVLVTACELYTKGSGSESGGETAAKIALTARLVATGSAPRVLWSDSVALTGDDSPGILGIGRIVDPQKLVEKAAAGLSSSLARYLEGNGQRPSVWKKSFEPLTSFRSPAIGSDLRENTVGFMSGKALGDEGAGRARIPVIVNARTGRTVSVEYSVAGGTAKRGGDYELREGVLTFPPGQTVQYIELDIRDDEFYEGDETIDISLRKPENALLGEITTNTFTIIENDELPKAGFLPAELAIPESGDPVTIIAELSAFSGKDVVLPVTIEGTATAQKDYRLLTPGPIVIKAGSKRAEIRIAPIDDMVDEPDKTIVVAMGIPENALQDSTVVSTVTLEDDDPEPVVSFGRSGFRAAENESVAGLDVTLDRSSEKTVSVKYGVTGGTAAERGVDYALRDGVLIFDPGDTIKHVDLEIVDDSVSEGDESVEVSLRDPKNAVLGKEKAYTYTIVDNDPQPFVQFAPAIRNVSESAGSVALVVELSALCGQDVVVPFKTGGTAKEAADYQVLTPNPLVIKAGTKSAEIVIALEDHERKEPARTIDIELAKPEQTALGALRVHRLHIADSKAEPRIAVLPFFNASSRKNAGDMLMLHFVKELQNAKRFEVVEPGIVRDQLLNLRIIMDIGMSLSDADLVFNALDADLVLCGRVMEYQDYEFAARAPKVEFSVELIERRSRKMVWSSTSSYSGDRGTVAFDWGRINTATDIAAELARVIANRMAAE